MHLFNFVITRPSALGIAKRHDLSLALVSQSWDTTSVPTTLGTQEEQACGPVKKRKPRKARTNTDIDDWSLHGTLQ